MLSSELLQHMNKEELVLFPAITRFFGTSGSLENLTVPFNFQHPLAVMEDEHQLAGDLVKKIRLLTDNYTPPSFACPTFKIAFVRLQEFDQDLMQHIHLENNVLFEKVKEAM